MKHKQISMAVAAFFGSVAVLPASAQSLASLVNDARAYDAAVLSAKIAWDAAKLRVDQAGAGLQPSASLSAGVSRQQSDTYPGAFDRISTRQGATLNGSYPLWRPVNRVTISQAERSAEIAKIAFDAAEQDLMVRVTQAYFDVLGAQDTMTFVRAQKAAVAEQLAAAKRNFEVGTSTITDSREAQARFDLVIAQEIAAENDLRVKGANLQQLVGKPATPLGLVDKATLPSPLPNDINAWVNTMEENHPSLRQARLALDVAKLETEKARLAERPTVDLTGSYDISANKGTTGTSSSLPHSRSFGVGVSMSMPLFTGGATQNRIKETLVLEDKARADLDTARRNLATAVRTSFFGVQSGLGQVKALEAAEASSQSALDANKLGYQVGVRINIDVLNSQSQLFQTKRDLAKAKYDVLVGGVRLRQANGSLQLGDLEAVDALLKR